MFIFNIKNKIINENFKNINLYSIKIKKNKKFILYLKEIKKNKFFVFDLGFWKNSTKSTVFIHYILGLTLSGRNAHVSLSDIKGNIIKKFTAGSLKFKKNKKRIIICLKTLIMTIVKNRHYFKDPLAIHFNNFYNKYLFDFVFKLFKKNRISIESYKFFSRPPHNGCRPKKIRRLKNRKVIF